MSLTGLVFASLMVLFQAGSLQADEWSRAEAMIRRLPPVFFKEVPAPVLRRLDEIGCRIPQTYYQHKPHNIIRGQFRKPGQFDWAVLCSKNGKSSILVFWAGSPEGYTAIAQSEEEDKVFLQDMGEGIGYSRQISPVGKDRILFSYRELGGTKPPNPIDHEGIDDAFIEKASTVLYWHKGSWLRLTGAD